MTIIRIDVSHHALELDPPFPASWDPAPRRRFPATIVRVTDSEGRTGVGSGEPLHGLEDYVDLFLGTDPLDLDRQHRIVDNISFFGSRMWPLEAALWDLAGIIQDRPVWQLVGGRSNRVRAYASTGVLRSASEMADVAAQALDSGFPALKLRFGRPDLADDLAVVATVRDRVGDRLELMVDCNQAWRMPWDVSDWWTVEQAVEVARRLEALDVYWMEEPLHRGDYEGMRRLRDATSVRIAGGEYTREIHEFREMLRVGCLDVYQPDAVLTVGIEGLRTLIPDIEAAGATFTPHTWGGGIGLVANTHLTAGAADAPYLEYPWDPPEWTAARRDYMLTETFEPDGDGWLHLSDAPGLDIELDEERLAATVTHTAGYR